MPVIIILFLLLQPRALAAEDFPTYPSIKKNVEFWTLIYSTHTSKQLVFHDAHDLMRIYGVVNLPKNVRPFTRRAERISKREKAKVKSLLLKFSRGEKPANLDEQIIYNYFPAETPLQDFKKAASRVRTQVGQADRFREGVIRSGLYLPYIRRVFAEYDLPERLSFLPHVESSFDYRAYSKFGAAGIWQFIRSTGRRFMKVGYTIDERRDPIRATVAAAKLLRSNYGQLKSWPLAITAYNHGVAGMRRAARHVGTRDYETIFNKYRGRRFGFASRNFYSSFLAAIDVSSNYRKYFGDLPIMKPLKYQSFTLPRSIDLPTLLAHLGVDEERFKFLNLGFRPAAYRYGKRIPKNYVVRLPMDDGNDYASLMSNLPKQAVARNTNLDWVQVQPGDTLWQLSKQLGVSVQELRAINDLSSSRLLAGQILKIPGRGGKKRPATRKPMVASRGPVKSANKKQLSGADLVTISPARSDSGVRLAKAWDTMVGEKRATVAPKAEQEAVGVWQGPHAPRQWHGSLAVLEMDQKRGKGVGLIVVEAEETLGHIAEWLDVSAQRVRNLNGFSFRRALAIGEKIRVPLTEVNKDEFEERRMRYHLSLQEDFYANYRVETVKDYTIRSGDSIWVLANEKLEVPMWLLREYNPATNLGDLRAGTKLTYPIIEPRNS